MAGIPEIGIYMGLEKNCIVSCQPSVYKQVSQVVIPQTGLYTHLKGFIHRGSGFVQVFQTVAQDGQVRYYMIYQPQDDLGSTQTRSNYLESLYSLRNLLFLHAQREFINNFA